MRTLLCIFLFLGGLHRVAVADRVEETRAKAEQGNAGEQNNPGVMYEYRRGVPQDYVQAYKWYNLSASKIIGPDRNKYGKNRDDVAAKMTPAQIAEAQKLAREWQPSPPKTDG